MDFLRIILDGYFDKNNREHLSKYFYRQFKKAEKDEFFEATEFFDGCDNILGVWEKDLTNRIHRRKEELYQLINIAQNDNTLSEEERSIKIKSFKKELENERPDGIGNSTYSIFLPNVTNNKVHGNLPYSEFEYIKASLLKAHIKSFKEELHQQAEIIIDTPEEEKQEESEYPTNMFASYTGYKIWRRLFDELDIKESDLTLIRFLFEVMKKDKFIHDTFKLVDLYDWLNKEYEYVVGKLKYTDPNWPSNKARMTAYNAIKENINQS